ncbi:hypothetical protein [Microcoleus sp.]|uniref:hypothetical protein n=1 Tax=Microcoleus sp. TaxID=44472 RepID=UPI003524D77F
MAESTSRISFDSWLSKFPDQELADRIMRSIVNDDFVKSPEAFIYNCIVAYYEAQKNYNSNPEKREVLELISPPIVGELINKGSNVKSQKTTYSVQFESLFEITLQNVDGWSKTKA